MDYTKMKGCHPGSDPVGLKGPDGMNTLSSYQAGREDTITLIRAEIERRVKELDEQIVDIYDSKAVLRKDELQRLLSFLDTLQEPSIEDCAYALLNALSKSPYNNKPITDAQVIVKELLVFLKEPNKYNPDAILQEQEVKEQKPELVQHPPITYTYPSDASRDEQLKRAILALLNSDLIKVVGNKFTKQDLIDWVEKQKPAEDEK